MKTLTSSLILVLTLAAAPSFAAKMDSETQNLVIDRLESIINVMENSDSSYIASNIRLADLLAERARLRFMNEIEENCKGCKGSGKDRVQALKIYSIVLPKTKLEQKGIILFQMAHLNEIGNDINKAMSIYQDILKTKSGIYSQQIVTRSRVALADLYFQKGQYKDAKALYQIALNDKLVPQKGFAIYRLGWCEYNLGNFETGIQILENLAGNKTLLVNQGSNGIVEDKGFQSDVLHDLVTFYSQSTVNEARINKFLNLVPKENKKEMTLLFAQETSRLGQKQAAATLYKIYLADQSLSKEESLNASLALVQTSYDQGQSKEAVEAFAQTATSYQKNCSDNEKCKVLQKQMRRFVVELHKLKISKLDADLLRAYSVYAQTFPEDVEMGVLGAQVAIDMNQHAKANQFYATAADNTKDAKLRETALLGEVEAAEESGSKELREKSYAHYLKLMPKGAKAYEIRYQVAHLSYEMKQWSKAADQFKSLALEKTTQFDLQKKSADLALDCLALEKRDADIENLALIFALKLPKHETEFRKLYRTSINTQVVKVANDSKASASDVKSALKKATSANMTGASDQEKIMHSNNIAVLAKRAGDEVVLMSAYSSLLAIKSLSAADREATLAAQVGYFEKKLEFKSAYAIAVKMKFAGLQTFERELKLGTLADLANLKPQKHYNKALSSGLKGAAEMSVRQRLVLLSASPAKELKKQSSKMSSNPKLMTDTALLIFAKNRNLKELNFVLNNSKMSNQSAVRFINKQYYYPKQQKLASKVAAHKLDLKSDATLAKSIQARLKLLTEADKSLSEAIGLKDFTAQMMALTLVSKENERLNQDLMNTPAPKGLTPKELARYSSMLKKSADPYLNKARFAQSKVQALWNQKSEWQNILRDYTKARSEVQNMIAVEIKILADLAPTQTIQDLLEDTLDNSRASQRDLISARDSVSDEPNNISQIEKLINLETKLGHPLMTTYLEQRLGQIQRGTRL